MTEFMGLAEKVSKFNQEALKHMERQTLNPFSGRFSRSPSPRPKFSKDEYGKPAAGSKTELRGQRAYTQISREILELCEVIHDMGRRRRDPDGDECIIIPFGELFAFYTKISDKVVGLLIAAKKRGFVWFEPEILFQRRDDDVLIALLKPIEEVRNIISRQISASPSPAPSASAEPEKTSPSSTPSPLARQESNTSTDGSSTAPPEKPGSSSASQTSEEKPTSSEEPSSNVAAETGRKSSTSDSLVPGKEEESASSATPAVESEQESAVTSEVETTAAEQVSSESSASKDGEKSVTEHVAVSEDQDSLTLKVMVIVEPDQSPSDEGAPGDNEQTSTSDKSGDVIQTTEEDTSPPSGDSGEKTLA